jgi:TonB family protein
MNVTLSAPLLAALSFCAVAAPQAPPGPASTAAVFQLMATGVPSEEIAETVLRTGISFEPTEDVLNEFRKAGAADVILRAMEESWRWESKGLLSDKDILELLAEHLPSDRVLSLIGQRRIGFEPSDEYLQGLRSSGVNDAIIDALRACAKRPISRDYLMQLLASRQDASQIEKLVEDHGIGFAPSEASVAGLRSAGAPESLLQIVRAAKRFNDARALCPSGSSLPVFPSLDDTNTTVARLACGDHVIIENNDSGRIGLVKILLADGREGFVQGTHLLSSPQGSPTHPWPIYKPEPPYSSQARRDKLQGTVGLEIDINAQGNVTDVREVGKRLGEGLDEKAIETVKTWRFLPATLDGVPVPTHVVVEIHFRLF